MSDNATEHILEWVEGRTDPVVDGGQNNTAAVWTGSNQIKAAARKDRIHFDVDELDEALEELREDEEIVTWHGLVTLATEGHLETIIQNEARSDVTRSLLVARCNRMLSGEEVPA